MITGIDHLVIAVHDVAAAAETLEADLGLAFTGGGRHEAMGTYNRLAFLGETYLELIGVFDAALVRSSRTFAVGNASLACLQERGEGLATYALCSDDVAGDVTRLRAAGSPIGDPVAGARRRPDGEEVRWITAFPELGPERAPFLIEHVYEGAEWGPAARAARAAFRHPHGGAVRLRRLELPASDPAAVDAEYATVLGLAADADGVVFAGDQALALRRAADIPAPVVHLEAEAGVAAPAMDLVRFGIRWVRPAETGAQTAA